MVFLSSWNLHGFLMALKDIIVYPVQLSSSSDLEWRTMLLLDDYSSNSYWLFSKTYFRNMCHREVQCIKYICGHETPTEGRRVNIMIKKDASNITDSFTKVDCGSSWCRYSATHALSCTNCSATCKQWCVYKLWDDAIFCQLLFWGLDLHARSLRRRIKNCVINVARHQSSDQHLPMDLFLRPSYIHSIFTTLLSSTFFRVHILFIILQVSATDHASVRINPIHAGSSQC